MSVEIGGRVAPGLERLVEAFAANFTRGDDYEEVGAALVVMREGERVVDLWAGSADAARTRPWTPETLVNVWSTTKGAAALCVAWAVGRGFLAYDQPVAELWPEFAAAGKGAITVAEAMSHQAGLPGWAETTTLDDLEDWSLVCGRLAAQAPVFAPGTANSYHAATYGFLAGEILRRATGRTLGRILAEELVGGADFFIGLPRAEDARVAELLAPRSPVDLSAMPLTEPARMALFNPEQDPGRPNRASFRRAEMPALNGQASARGVCAVYDLIAMGGKGRVAAGAIDRMCAIAADRDDLMLGFNPQWGMGVAHNLIGVYGPNPATVGHSGWGGSFGCADRDRRLSIGYVCNQMGSELVGDPRGAGLAAAVYDALG